MRFLNCPRWLLADLGRGLNGYKCIGHILIGGSNLTGPAQRKFNQYKEEFEQDGKLLAYISNEGITRLELEYKKSITLAPKDSEND